MTAKKLAQVSEALLRLNQDNDRFHVISRGSSWVVKRERAERAIKVYPQRSEAVDRARSLAQGVGGEVIVHHKDGTIAERHFFRAHSQAI